MAKYAIQASNLTKVYKDKAVVKNVSLAIKEGEIYGFIGKNGAGKTTVMRLIGGLAAPDSGEISIFGSSGKKELADARKNMGCLIESPSYYGNMTALENMEIRRLQLGLEPKELSEDALVKVGLDPKDPKKVKNFSLGMKQRLGIAVAALRQAAPAGDRPRAGDAAEASDARRADKRFGPCGNRGNKGSFARA